MRKSRFRSVPPCPMRIFGFVSDFPAEQPLNNKHTHSWLPLLKVLMGCLLEIYATHFSRPGLTAVECSAGPPFWGYCGCTTYTLVAQRRWFPRPCRDLAVSCFLVERQNCQRLTGERLSPGSQFGRKTTCPKERFQLGYPSSQ